MPSSTSHSKTRGAHSRGAHGGGGSHDDEGGGGGGGGGGGKLVKVAFARTQPEAEMLQGLLREGGIPSVLRRSGGFDNPDFLAAGPHDVMVSAPAAKDARALLADTLVESETDERSEVESQIRAARGEGAGGTSPATLAFWIGVALVGAFGLVWLLYQLS